MTDPTFKFMIRVSPEFISQDVVLDETLLMDLGSLVYSGLERSHFIALEPNPD